MSNRLWVTMLNEWRENFSEIKVIYTKVSYKDRTLRKTLFSISLGQSLIIPAFGDKNIKNLTTSMVVIKH